MIRTGLLLCSLALLSACASYQSQTAQSSQPEAELTSESRKVTGDIRLLSTWPGEVQETSGLAQKGSLLWTINDSGDGPWLYALDDTHGVKKKVRVSNAKNIDWEELAQDEEYLYVADCGNNRGKRQRLQIYKISWDSLNKVADGSEVTAKKLQFEYADKPQSVPSGSHNFDCEALTVVGGELWLFTKNRADQKTNFYRLSKDDVDQHILPSASYAVDGLITAADYDERNNRLVLLGYGKNVLFGQSFLWLIPVDEKPLWSQAQFLKLTPYAQWEALKWDVRSDQGRLILSTERSPLLDVGLGELYLPVN